LGTFVEVDGQAILKTANDEAVPFHIAERRVLGIDHPEVGAVLLAHWNLPRVIIDAVRWHKEPDKFEGDHFVVNLVHLADHIAGTSGVGGGVDGLSYAPSRNALEEFPLTVEIAESIVLKAYTAFESLMPYMK